MSEVYIEQGRIVRIETRWDIVVIASRMLIGVSLIINGAAMAFAAGMLAVCRWTIPEEVQHVLFESLVWTVSVEIVLRGIDLFLSRYEKTPIDRDGKSDV